MRPKTRSAGWGLSNGRVATRTRQGAGHLFGTHDASSASLRSTAQREITSSVRRRVHRIPRAPAQPCGPEKLLRSHCRNGIHHLPHATVPGRPASPRRVERPGISVITDMLARSTRPRLFTRTPNSGGSTLGKHMSSCGQVLAWADEAERVLSTACCRAMIEAAPRASHTLPPPPARSRPSVLALSPPLPRPTRPAVWHACL